LLLGMLQAWLLLTALAQLMHVGHWPMSLFGVAVPRGAALGVALVRLGLYSGLAWGLGAREPSAWAGTVLELVRTVLVLVLLVLLRRWTSAGVLYPAPWSQGLLGGALPAAMLANLALDAGWRPGSGLEVMIFSGAQMLAGLGALAALWLRDHGLLFGVPPSERGKVLFGKGLPLVLVIGAAEALAVLAALRP
jgi:hypothetical protein